MQLICSSGRISLHLLFVIAANIADNCFKLFVCLLAIDASATFFLTMCAAASVQLLVDN